MAQFFNDEHLPSGRSTPVSANKEIRQITEGFMASPAVKKMRSPPKQEIEQVVATFLRCCYERLGRAPWYLSGKEFEEAFTERFPPFFTGKESYLAKIPALIEALFDHLAGEKKLAHAKEVREKLASEGPKFAEYVSKVADEKRLEMVEAVQPIVKASAQPGRNDPCPCGSGKKYKKCCYGKTAQQ